MELTLKRLLEQAKFTTTRKGYDQEEVDDFLDRAVAMATKVEARLTQALAEAGSAAPVPAEPVRSAEEIQAEVDQRVSEQVQARLAEIEAERPAAREDATDATADEAARTLVLAQRTADAAVAEAREEAEGIVVRARAEAEQLASAAQADAERARAEARGRLAEEIRTLEEARNGLRADVSLLEGHVEEQRLQLRSTVAELQRLLDDPGAFRLAPAPETAPVGLPDAPAPVDPPPGNATPADTIDLTRPAGSFDPPGDSPPAAADPDPDQGLDVGPPTAPVSAVDLDVDPAGDPDPAPNPTADAQPEPQPEPGSGSGPEASADRGSSIADPIDPVDVAADDDAFLAELRKAMADEEPLGPRDGGVGDPSPNFLDDERRGWRFGKRR